MFKSMNICVFLNMVVCLCDNKKNCIDVYRTISAISKSVACILSKNKQYFCDHFILGIPYGSWKWILIVELNKYKILTDHCEVIVVVMDIICYVCEHKSHREHTMKKSPSYPGFEISGGPVAEATKNSAGPREHWVTVVR